MITAHQYTLHMISLDEIRRLMEEPGMSDDEADAIRASCYELAAILIENWRDKRDAVPHGQGLARGTGRPELPAVHGYVPHPVGLHSGALGRVIAVRFSLDSENAGATRYAGGVLWGQLDDQEVDMPRVHDPGFEQPPPATRKRAPSIGSHQRRLSVRTGGVFISTPCRRQRSLARKIVSPPTRES